MRDLDIWQDISPFQSHYLGLAEYIKNNCKGRKIVFHGELPILEHLLKDKYDLNVDCISTSIEERTSLSERHRKLGYFKGKSTDFFIVVTFLDYDERLKKRIENLGYTEFKDFVFFNHKPLFFPKGKIISYQDEYGINIVSDGSIPISIGKKCWNADIKILETNRVGADSKIIVLGSNNHLFIGKKCVFSNNTTMVVWNNSAIEIGDKCTFGEDCAFHAENGSKITIGYDCMFSREVITFAGDGHSILDVNSGETVNQVWPLNNKSDVVIGDHVWVGLRNTILSSTIGNSSIIGASSLVKGKYNNNSIIAGVPAKMIKKDITWSRYPYCDSVDSVSPEFINCTNLEV